MADATQCFYCGLAATHFCAGCGNYVCDSLKCAAQAAASAIVQNPLRAISLAPAAVFQIARGLGTTIADVTSDILGFKP